jgi:cysteine desulfurase
MNTLGVTSPHPGLADGPIYLSTTTPPHRSTPAWQRPRSPYLTTHFGNPSSGHDYAERPRRALAEARQQLAGLIGAEPAEMVFTAGGSEANNLAIRGAAPRP